MTTSSLSSRSAADVVRDKLSLYLGPFTSKNSVQVMARKTLGIDAETLTAAQMPALLDALGPTLRILLGKPAAEKVVAEIRQELSV